MHRILVEEKKWISESRFLHALSYCTLLPGPEAQQLATYVGWLMHRTAGGLMAGGLFVLPGLVSIMALSIIYAGWGKVGIVGYCFGGSVAWAGATRTKYFSASSCYYGGQIASMAEEKPSCPVQMHFGEKDQGIPMSDVEIVKQKQPQHPLFVYKDAGHGFSCDARGSFHPATTSNSRLRSVSVTFARRR